jgi:hypothetical protein
VAIWVMILVAIAGIGGVTAWPLIKHAWLALMAMLP